ncbi:MAG: alpha/beta hydrolase [Woeseiaceae bacterium]
MIRVANRAFWILLATLIVSSYGASLVQTSFGQVDVQSVKFPMQNGQWLVGDLFRPISATSENPAPLVIVVPGFQRSKEALSNIAIELARRDIVAISIDPYAQGGSSASMSRRAATTEGYGMFAVVEYAADTPNLNYIDKSRIGATGHSAGGNAAIRGASYFGREAQRTGRPSKLHSVFVSGYVLTLTEDVLNDVRSNVGMSYAFYDEGAYRNELGNADMRAAPEALRLVNIGRDRSLPPVEEVELGKYYGDVAARKLLGLISLIVSLVMLVPLARVLLQIPYFGSLVHPVPPPLPASNGRGRILFWTLFATGALIACVSYIPMAELSEVLFVKASTRVQTWFFPQRMNNAVMMWAVLNGLAGYLMFWLAYRFHGRQHGVVPAMWGTQVTRNELVRTVFLGLLLYAAYYVLLFAMYFFFHVDYRFLFMGVRIFRAEELWLLLMYAPFFFVFFLSNSLRVNGSLRVAGQPEWRSMLIAGLGNSLGLLLIVVVQYVTFWTTGTVYWTDGWLYINLLFAVVPMMFVLPYFNRYFFHLTGRIYLGPIVTCLVFIMILLTNTVVYIPL